MYILLLIVLYLYIYNVGYTIKLSKTTELLYSICNSINYKRDS